MNGTEERKTLKFASWVSAVTLLALLGMGCAAKVNHEVLMNTKKVGILSITIDKLGTQATDDEVMQNTVNYAAPLYVDALSKRPEWKLVPLTYREAAFQDFLTPPVLPNRPEPKTFMEKIQRINEDLEASFNTENLVKKDSAKYLGAANMPIIPYSFLESLIGKKQPEHPTKPQDMNGIKLDMARKIGQLATKLNLDGLLVIYLRTGIYSSVGIDVAVGNRAMDTVRMEPTLVLVSRNGKTAIDMGPPVIGHGSTKNAGMPIYKLSGFKGIGMATGGKKTSTPDAAKYPIDLKDPNGKVQKDMYALTDLALRDFMKTLDKTLEKK